MAGVSRTTLWAATPSPSHQHAASPRRHGAPHPSRMNGRRYIHTKQTFSTPAEPSCTATSAKRLCTSSATVLMTTTSSTSTTPITRGGSATRHLWIRARSAQPDTSKGRPDICTGSHGPHARRPAHSLSSPLPLLRSHPLRNQGQRPLLHNRDQRNSRRCRRAGRRTQAPTPAMSANTPHHQPQA
jgi:hypothetical protein